MSTNCPAYTHQHPGLVLALDTRTRLVGTLNIAIALRGKSCGWGTCQHPRRTFIGHHRLNRKQGRHFVRLSVTRDTMRETVWKRTLWGQP